MKNQHRPIIVGLMTLTLISQACSYTNGDSLIVLPIFSRSKRGCEVKKGSPK